jgi:hypothetical protein
MDLTRLFHVLVVGGVVTVGCERPRKNQLGVTDGATEVAGDDAAAERTLAQDAVAASDTVAIQDVATSADVNMSHDLGMSEDAGMGPDDAATPDATTKDAAVIADASAVKDAGGGMGSPCFCSPTKCCELHDGGPATVQAGVFCCWSTKC